MHVESVRSWWCRRWRCKGADVEAGARQGPVNGYCGVGRGEGAWETNGRRMRQLKEWPGVVSDPQPNRSAVEVAGRIRT